MSTFFSIKQLEHPSDNRFWRRIVIDNEKWLFYRSVKGENVRMVKSAAQPTVQAVAKQDRFAQKVMLCVVWRNFEEIINHFELVQTGVMNAAALYIEQLDLGVHAALAARRCPAALINQMHALLEHNNALGHALQLF